VTQWYSDGQAQCTDVDRDEPSARQVNPAYHPMQRHTLRRVVPFVMFFSNSFLAGGHCRKIVESAEEAFATRPPAFEDFSWNATRRAYFWDLTPDGRSAIVARANITRDAVVITGFR
jgi:hypothetical protein